MPTITAQTPKQKANSHDGAGTRLALAFAGLDTFPALAAARERLLSVIATDTVETTDVVSAVESDVALILAVLRLANRGRSGRKRLDTVRSAVELLPPQDIRALALRLPTFDFFERTTMWGSEPGRFRLHALLTQRAADRIACELEYKHRDRLAVTSVLHDVGKLALIHAYPGYPSQVHLDARTPEDRVHHERRELGVEHALIGGALTRRWNLPESLATAIERHHNADAEGDAALIRVADMLAHYQQGTRVCAHEMLRCARGVGLGPQKLRQMMYELPNISPQRRRHIPSCPLSGRELAVLRRLATGRVYKQIAHDLGLSESGIRSHLHNIYVKLGTVDRAQTVLAATSNGWI